MPASAIVTLCTPYSVLLQPCQVTGCYFHPAVTLCYPASLYCHFVSPAVTLVSLWLLATEFCQHLGCWCNPIDTLCHLTITLCHAAVTLLSLCSTMSPYFHPVFVTLLCHYCHPAVSLCHPASPWVPDQVPLPPYCHTVPSCIPCFDALLCPTVNYDSCPRAIEAGIWWPRTRFGLPAAAPCPKGSVGTWGHGRGHHWAHSQNGAGGDSGDITGMGLRGVDNSIVWVVQRGDTMIALMRHGGERGHHGVTSGC